MLGMYEIYRIKTPTGNAYYGQHFNRRYPQKDRRYMGSGIRIQNSIKKYGRENHVYVVLRVCETKEEADNAEKEVIAEARKLIGDRCVNLACGGQGIGPGRNHSPEHRERMRQALRRPEIHEKLRQAKLGKHLSPEHCEKIRQARLGKHCSPETIEKMRQVHLGKKRSSETCEKIRRAALGRKWSPETIEKMRQANLGKHRSPEAIEKTRLTNLGRKLSSEAREKMRQAHLGKKKSPEHREKLRQANLGRIPWNKGKKGETA